MPEASADPTVKSRRSRPPPLREATLLAAGCLWLWACTSAPRQLAAEPRPTTEPQVAPPPNVSPVSRAANPTPSPSPAPSGPVPRLLEVGTPSGEFGKAAPVSFGASAPGGGWLIWCEAREDTDGDKQRAVRIGAQGEVGGDALGLYFAVGGGVGTRIDAFLGASHDGRFVGVIEQGALSILDTLRHTALSLTHLGASLATDLAPYRPHRALAFSPNLPSIVYHREKGDHTELVVRDLEKSTEVTLTSPGDVWRAHFDDSGALLVAEVVDTDTNKNKRFDWPHPRAKTTPLALGNTCPLPTPRFSVWKFPGDEPTPFIARTSGSAWLRAPGFVHAFGNELIVRSADAKLELESAPMSTTETVPPAVRRLLVNEKCDARVLHVDAERRKVVAACMGGKLRGEVVVLGGPERILTGVRVAPFEIDRWQAGAPRLLPLYPGSSTVLLDLDTNAVLPLKDGDHVLLSRGETALVRNGRSLVFVDPQGNRVPLVGEPRAYEPVVVLGDLVAVAPFVVDVPERRVLGRYQGVGVALRSDGAVLTASHDATDPSTLSTGPFRWQLPTAQAP